MRKLLVLAILLTLGPVAGAQVLRCTDAAGKVTYTNEACPAGTRPVWQVQVPAATPQTRSGGEPYRPAARDDTARNAAEATPRAATPPAAPLIIDSRGSGNAGGASSAQSTDIGTRGDGTLVVDDGYYYPPAYPYPRTARAPRPQPDMRPRIRQCDGAGCQDTQGNHYGTGGQLDRYRSIDGRTCRPIGTTSVCR